MPTPPAKAHRERQQGRRDWPTDERLGDVHVASAPRSGSAPASLFAASPMRVCQKSTVPTGRSRDRSPASCRASGVGSRSARRRWRCRADGAVPSRRPCQAPAESRRTSPRASSSGWAETQQARLIDRVERRAGLPRARASSAKSTIMMAFFCTMPMSRMMPISAMTFRSSWKHQRQQRADAGRGQRGKNRDRDG